ncbi:Hypothetical protein PHPALM_3602 [Phytophthora palmivora]|uniref:Uncharacterized protein n=1 Tax=Phytophthora palmivora TaxID=4796 RepID=A0A2P4YLY8_9STRA|nr:Hypothetical protein PHPALM_3602 [Phytophthora palmivora]
MGDILLSEGVMEQLGYTAQTLTDHARVVQSVYDMDEDAAMTGVCRVLAYGATANYPEPTPEEKVLQSDEDLHCFPEVHINQDQEKTRAQEWKILTDKLGEAARLRCSASF